MTETFLLWDYWLKCPQTREKACCCSFGARPPLLQSHAKKQLVNNSFSTIVNHGQTTLRQQNIVHTLKSAKYLVKKIRKTVYIVHAQGIWQLYLISINTKRELESAKILIQTRTCSTIQTHIYCVLKVFLVCITFIILSSKYSGT